MTTVTSVDPDEILDLRRVQEITGYGYSAVKEWIKPDSANPERPVLRTFRINEGKTAKRLTTRRDLDTFIALRSGRPARKSRRSH